MSDILHFLMQFCFYAVAMVGLWMIVSPMIEHAVRYTTRSLDFRLRMKMKVFGNRMPGSSKKGSWFKHLDDLLYIAQDQYVSGWSVYQFLIRNLILFLSVFLITFITIGELPGRISFGNGNPFIDGVQLDQIGVGRTWPFPLFFSMLIATIPYFRLRYQASVRRVKASYDLTEVVQILTKFAGLSVDAALHHTAQLLRKDNVLRQPVFILSHTFSTYGSEAELRSEIRRFNRTVDTTFALQLTSDLLYTEKEGGTYLQEHLTHLREEMEQQRASILDVQNNSRDAVQMGFWGNLLVLVICCGTMIWFLQPHVYFHLQFQTQYGLVFLSLILVSLFVSFIISFVLSRPKLDYK